MLILVRSYKLMLLFYTGVVRSWARYLRSLFICELICKIGIKILSLKKLSQIMLMTALGPFSALGRQSCIDGFPRLPFVSHRPVDSFFVEGTHILFPLPLVSKHLENMICILNPFLAFCCVFSNSKFNKLMRDQIISKVFLIF